MFGSQRAHELMHPATCGGALLLVALMPAATGLAGKFVARRVHSNRPARRLRPAEQHMRRATSAVRGGYLAECVSHIEDAVCAMGEEDGTLMLEGYKRLIKIARRTCGARPRGALASQTLLKHCVDHAHLRPDAPAVHLVRSARPACKLPRANEGIMS